MPFLCKIIFVNIISFDFYTFCPTLFQFFYPLKKVGTFKALKILIHIHLIRRKSLFPKSDREIWK